MVFVLFCTQVKPSTNVAIVETDVLRDQGSKKGTLKSTEEILANGGCKHTQTIYENGQEWHPVLSSHGEQKCIKCRCKVNILKPLFMGNIY